MARVMCPVTHNTRKKWLSRYWPWCGLWRWGYRGVSLTHRGHIYNLVKFPALSLRDLGVA